MSELKLAQASGLIAAALVEGRRRGLAPLAVAVLDAGGHLVAFGDEACALAGIAAVGLVARPGAIES